jgi:hypothetical protein
VRGREPGEPDGKQVFAKAERPIGKRFGNCVGSGACGGFGPMGGERDPASEECGDPAPFCGEACGDAETQNGGGGGPDESMEKIPDGVEVRNFVGEKFEDVECDGEAEDNGMRENVKFFGEMNDVEAFEKAESGDGSVEIEAGGETGAEGEGDGLERIHRRDDIQFNCGGVCVQRDCARREKKQIPNSAEGAEFGMTMFLGWRANLSEEGPLPATADRRKAAPTTAE